MKRFKHSLTHFHNTTMAMGNLVPVGLTEVLPGDTIQHSLNALIRMAPMVAPVMTPLHATIHHWFVPFRLIWEDWEKFITGGPDGNDASVFPTITFATGPAQSTLANYLGVPAKVTGFNTDGIVCSALPFRAAALVYNEWYRDQDLITALTISKASGNDTTTSTALQKVAWGKDYFNTSRPWAQKGDAVTIPLGGEIPIERVSNAPAWKVFVQNSNTDGGNTANLNIGASGILKSDLDAGNSLDPQGGLVGDLSNATVVGIDALREAFAIQRYKEARARYGSRYTEYLAYLGIKSSDARLQRPEYLGGGRQTIQFSEVLQTAEGTDPVGTMRGHGIGAMSSNRYRKFFEEHGFIISFMHVQPISIYIQGIPRLWNRRTKEDFWQKELEHIGQQEVLNKELYAVPATGDDVFGYQDRYDEYRRTESRISGEFATTAYSNWHLARDFASLPVLNSSFINSNPSSRIFADTSTPAQLLLMMKHSMQARRMVTAVGSSFIK